MRHHELSAKSSKRKSPRYIIFLGTLVVLLGIVVTVLIFRQGSQPGKTKAAYDKSIVRSQTVADELINTLGDKPINQEKNASCYMAEQGPYDHGRLWCQTGLMLYYASTIDGISITSHVEQIIQQHGWKLSGNESSAVEFDGSGGLTCQIDVYHDNFAMHPTHGFKGDPNAKTAVMILCADRAQSMFYPQMDN